jgi:hypothetical protein
MTSEIGSALLALAVMAALAFGILAAFPRSRKGLVQGTLANLVTATTLTAFGSGLVGPLDLRAMLIWAPVTLSCTAVWYFWQIRPRLVS